MAALQMPAIVFDEDELDAVIAGLVMLGRSVNEDDELTETVDAALARIEVVLPDTPSGRAPNASRDDGPHHAAIRQAIHRETKLRLRYVDRKGAASERIIWPLELGFFGAGDTIAAWCETRQDFRHFRLDRIVTLEATAEPYPLRRRILVARLRADEMDQGW